MTAADPVELRMIAPSPTPNDAVAQLLDNINPIATGEDRFVIEVGADVLHIFGGMLSAQALRCAQRTVGADRRVSSVHAYFLRRARPELPLEFEVQRDNDGRSFSARRVDVWQESRKVFSLMCLFHVPDRHWEALTALPADVPLPEAVAHARMIRFGDAFEVREVLPRAIAPGEQHSPGQLWARVANRLPDDPDIHDCLLLYVSDMGTPWHFATPPEVEVSSSLDHSIWFHHPATMDSWHYIDLEADSAADARGLYTGHIWNADGTQVATVAQENLLRRARPTTP